MFNVLQPNLSASLTVSFCGDDDADEDDNDGGADCDSRVGCQKRTIMGVIRRGRLSSSAHFSSTQTEGQSPQRSFQKC